MCEGYLAWRWGLQGKLPVGHPYKNTSPGVDWDPDKLGFASTYAWYDAELSPKTFM